MSKNFWNIKAKKCCAKAAANRPALCSAGKKMLRCKSYRRSANGGTLPFSAKVRAIKAALAAGVGIRRIARECKASVETVLRVRAEMGTTA